MQSSGETTAVSGGPSQPQATVSGAPLQPQGTISGRPLQPQTSDVEGPNAAQVSGNRGSPAQSLPIVAPQPPLASGPTVEGQAQGQSEGQGEGQHEGQGQGQGEGQHQGQDQGQGEGQHQGQGQDQSQGYGLEQSSGHSQGHNQPSSQGHTQPTSQGQPSQSAPPLVPALATSTSPLPGNITAALPPSGEPAAPSAPYQESPSATHSSLSGSSNAQAALPFKSPPVTPAAAGPAAPGPQGGAAGASPSQLPAAGSQHVIFSPGLAPEQLQPQPWQRPAGQTSSGPAAGPGLSWSYGVQQPTLFHPLPPSSAASGPAAAGPQGGVAGASPSQLPAAGSQHVIFNPGLAPEQLQPQPWQLPAGHTSSGPAAGPGLSWSYGVQPPTLFNPLPPSSAASGPATAGLQTGPAGAEPSQPSSPGPQRVQSISGPGPQQLLPGELPGTQTPNGPLVGPGLNGAGTEPPGASHPPPTSSAASGPAATGPHTGLAGAAPSLSQVPTPVGPQNVIAGSGPPPQYLQPEQPPFRETPRGPAAGPTPAEAVVVASQTPMPAAGLQPQTPPTAPAGNRSSTNQSTIEVTVNAPAATPASGGTAAAAGPVALPQGTAGGSGTSLTLPSFGGRPISFTLALTGPGVDNLTPANRTAIKHALAQLLGGVSAPQTMRCLQMPPAAWAVQLAVEWRNIGQECCTLQCRMLRDC